MFSIPQPTPFDITFRLLGIPVRVSVWFWAIGLLLGYPLLNQGVAPTLVWLLAMFLSVLVHEFGHALTAKFFGFPPDVTLHGFGGVARYYPAGPRNTPFSAIMITLAGPGAGFLLFALVLIVNSFAVQNHVAMEQSLGEPGASMVLFLLNIMQIINFYWTILNLLPVFPLDGGRILNEIIKLFKPHTGFWITVKISIVLAGCLAFYFYQERQTYTAVMFVMLAFNNFQMLQQREFYN